MRINAKQVAEMFKLNDDGRSAQKWAKDKKLSAIKDGKRWMFDIHEVIQFGYDNGYLEVKITDEEELAPNVRKDLADARLKELKLEVEKGKYYSRDEIDQSVAMIMSAARNRFLGLPSKLASHLVEIKTPAEAHKILEDEIYEALTELSRLETVV